MDRITIKLDSHYGNAVDPVLLTRISNIALGNGCLVNKKMDELKNAIREIMGSEKRLKKILKILHKNNLPAGEIT